MKKEEIKVWFKSENLGIDIKLSEKDAALMEQQILKGKLCGEINGHTYNVRVSFSLNCSGKYETITPPMQRAIRQRIVDHEVALHFTDAYTTSFSTGTDEGFRLSRKDLLSLCKYYKKHGRTTYIVVDIHTKLIWDNKEY